MIAPLLQLLLARTLRNHDAAAVTMAVMIGLVRLHDHFPGQFMPSGAARDLRQQLERFLRRAEIRQMRSTDPRQSRRPASHPENPVLWRPSACRAARRPLLSPKLLQPLLMRAFLRRRIHVHPDDANAGKQLRTSSSSTRCVPVPK